MPEIARFMGIVITIYMEVDEVHQIPHFHVRYGEYQASYSIRPIAGTRRSHTAGNSVWSRPGRNCIKRS